MDGGDVDEGQRGDRQWGSVPALARAVGRSRATHDAVVTAELTWTYGELMDVARRAGRGLVALGVEPGDRVAVWAPNLPEWVASLIGLHSAGAALVPLNTRYKGAEAADILRRSRARVLVTVDGFLANDYLAMLAGEPLADLLATVVLRPGRRSVGDRGPGGAPVHSWDALLDLGDGVDPAVLDGRIDTIGPDDVSDLIYTSGTTGRPKGVVTTHGQTLRAFADWAAIVGLCADDRYLLVNPMFHSFGYKAGIVATLLAGATLVPLTTFDPGAVLATIPAERITVIPGPPTLYQSLLEHRDLAATDRSTLRLAVTGAATIPTELVRRMGDDLGFDTVLTAYGLTEACGFVTACRPGDPLDLVATTSGRAIPGVELATVDDHGRPVPAGAPGEVVVRGYNVMRGYDGDPGQTAEVIDEAGWLRTGDVGILDAAGNLRITDRIKDMFIVGGFNAYPAEIEDGLLGHPGIARAAVVGVPEPRLGEVGVAFVVAAAGAELDPAEVVAWARARMANFKAPRLVHVVDELPLNASGKVLRYELRDRAVATFPGPAGPPI